MSFYLKKDKFVNFDFVVLNLLTDFGEQMFQPGDFRLIRVGFFCYLIL